MSATEIKRTKDSRETLLRNAKRIGANRKAHLMFHETDRTGFGTDFRRVIEEMFELTDTKDGYYHYYVAKESFNYEQFVVVVLPLLDSICVPAQRLTWEEFEARFGEFIGGTVMLEVPNSPAARMSIVGLKLCASENDPFLEVTVPVAEIPSWLTGDAYPDGYRAGSCFRVYYHGLRDGSEDLGLTPIDHHDGTIGVSKVYNHITFYPPDHRF